MLRIGIILGSTRPGRKGAQVAEWVVQRTNARTDAQYELIDLADHPLPHLDERIPPSMGRYEHDHTKKWAELIAQFDGFVVVTPEYNHGPSGVLKNAFDYLYAEWNNKAVGFVGYGSVGAARAVEQLRLVAGELQMADVRVAVALPFASEFKDYKEFRPTAGANEALDEMLHQLESWSGALQEVRRDQRRERMTG